MTATVAWLQQRTSGAPPALARRVHEWFAQSEPGHPLGERLAGAGRLALAESVARGEGRESALDLLAADALVTLALLERAERDPADLGRAAAALAAEAAEAP